MEEKEEREKGESIDTSFRAKIKGKKFEERIFEIFHFDFLDKYKG